MRGEGGEKREEGGRRNNIGRKKEKGEWRRIG